MTFKVKVYYRDKNDSSLKKLFWSRGVRKLSNNRPCINYQGKIYKIFPFKEDVMDSVLFDITSPHQEVLADCPLVNSDEAKAMLQLIVPISNLDINPQVIESYDELTKDIPEFVFTDPIKISMSLTSEAKQVSIQPKINLHQFTLPQFNDEWFIERTKWYVYVLVNKDAISQTDDRIDFISTMLDEPKSFRLPNSLYFHIDHTIFHNIFIEKSSDAQPQNCLTSFKEFLLDEPIELSKHETLYDKWGEIDFEERDSIRPSVNGIMYDHWFRFDLSYSDKDLQDLFHDLFSIYSMNLVSPNILSVERGFHVSDDAFLRPKIYLTPPNPNILEREIDINAWTNELETENELVSKENKALKEQLDKTIIDKMLLEESLAVLKNDIEKFKERHKKQIDNMLKTFFGQEIVLLRRGKKVLRNFESPDGTFKVLQQLIRDESSVIKKKANRTNHWLEIDKKINNGQDEQGRLYVYKTNSDPTRFVILVGHKQDQKSDIEYLRKNDPPEGWDK